MNQREFLYLCARGNYNEVEEAIKNGASLNRRAMYQGASVPPLFVAAMESNFPAMTALLAHNAKCFPAFLAAMIMEDNYMFSYLVENCRADINCKDVHKRTPLLCAVTSNKTNVVKWLLELGADVNIPVGLGYNVLTYAAFMFEEDEENFDPKIIKLLMDAGADYREAIIGAIKTNNIKLAKLLIKNGADLNAAYYMDQSPLSIAILNLSNTGDEGLKMIKLFIENGANVNEFLELSENSPEREDENNMPILTRNITLAISIESVKCLELLLKNGANPNYVDSKGRTPLIYSVLTSREMLELLLKYGADPNVGDREGRTPLFLAVIDNDVEDGTIEILLKHGANPNIQDSSGYTPLTWAVNNHDKSSEYFIAALIRTGAVMTENGADLFGLAFFFEALKREVQLETVKTLIKYGADSNIPDKKGITALGWAMMNFDEEILEIFGKSSRQDVQAKKKN